MALSLDVPNPRQLLSPSRHHSKGVDGKEKKNNVGNEETPSPSKDKETNWLRKLRSTYQKDGTEKASWDLEGHWKHPAPEPDSEEHFLILCQVLQGNGRFTILGMDITCKRAGSVACWRSRLSCLNWFKVSSV
eukprot:1158976-Pelagomonas_calceolata.AAC.7